MVVGCDDAGGDGDAAADDDTKYDDEHGYGDVSGITRQLQTIKETNCSALVRMPRDDEVYVKKSLDSGVNCLMFPAVNNKKEAENIVEMCRYAPKGYRGVAPGMIRATNY